MKTKKQLEREIKWHWILTIILFLGIFAGSFNFYKIGISKGVEKTEYYFQKEQIKYLNALETVEPKIDVNNLNKEDRRTALNIVGLINPKYLQGTKEIYFDYDIMDDYIKLGNNYLEYTELHGFHIQKDDENKIFIQFDDYFDMKDTLCHETLHSWFINTPTSHELIDNMVKRGICYETTY